MLAGHYEGKGAPPAAIHLPSFIPCFSSLPVFTRKERAQRDCFLEREPTGGLQRALDKYIREEITFQGSCACQ